MTTATRARKPQTRIARLHTFGAATVLGITQGKLTVFYTLERLDTDIGGTAFQLTKAHNGSGEEPETYHVLLNGKDTSCTCKGNAYCGHCKHVEAILALIKSGKIDVPAAKPQAEPEPIEFDDP